MAVLANITKTVVPTSCSMYRLTISFDIWMTLATIVRSMVFTVCFFFSGFPFFSAAFSYNDQHIIPIPDMICCLVCTAKVRFMK